MILECFNGHKQHFNMFLDGPEEVTRYVRNLNRKSKAVFFKP